MRSIFIVYEYSDKVLTENIIIILKEKFNEEIHVIEISLSDVFNQDLFEQNFSKGQIILIILFNRSTIKMNLFESNEKVLIQMLLENSMLVNKTIFIPCITEKINTKIF